MDRRRRIIDNGKKAGKPALLKQEGDICVHGQNSVDIDIEVAWHWRLWERVQTTLTTFFLGTGRTSAATYGLPGIAFFPFCGPSYGSGVTVLSLSERHVDVFRAPATHTVAMNITWNQRASFFHRRCTHRYTRFCGGRRPLAQRRCRPRLLLAGSHHNITSPRNCFGIPPISQTDENIQCRCPRYPKSEQRHCTPMPSQRTTPMQPALNQNLSSSPHHQSTTAHQRS